MLEVLNKIKYIFNSEMVHFLVEYALQGCKVAISDLLHVMGKYCSIKDNSEYKRLYHELRKLYCEGVY